MSCSMRALELFAGAGGAALGLEAAGLEHAGLVELDPDACKTLRAAGLGPVIEGDVRDLDAVEAVAGQGIDVLWSSFPCQAWSTAGSRQGAKDDRNGWPWTVDAIDRFRPTWFLGENVRGLQQHNKHCTARGGQRQLFDKRPELSCAGCYLERVILPDLRARFGHAGAWLLDAADYGVPQHRRRLILWAGPQELKRPRQTHGPEAARPWVSMATALGLEPSQRVIGGGMNPRIGETRRFRDITDEPSTTVAAVQIGNAGPWITAGGAGAPRTMDRPAPAITGAGDAQLHAVHPLTGQPGGSQPWRLDQPSLPVLARDAKGYSGGLSRGRSPCGAADGFHLATGKRRLTIEQCARLQDFPDGHPFQGTLTARYRQVGNAVPPTLARVVAESLLASDHDSNRRGQP